MTRLRRLGWAIFIVGVLWDLGYHVLLAANTPLPPVVDVLGDLGHALTLGGVALVILSLIYKPGSS